MLPFRRTQPLLIKKAEDMHQISSRKKMEAMRDEVIVDNLGRDYELIRISTENINLNVTKLMKAVDTVLKKRKMKNSR